MLLFLNNRLPKKIRRLLSLYEHYFFLRSFQDSLHINIIMFQNLNINLLYSFFFSSYRSTTLSFVWQYSSPTKWHFAAHMGQLMRDTIDSFGRSTGCSELWPQCPFNSVTLLQLNKKDASFNH